MVDGLDGRVSDRGAMVMLRRQAQALKDTHGPLLAAPRTEGSDGTAETLARLERARERSTGRTAPAQLTLDIGRW